MGKIALITQRDFYSMKAFFSDLKETGLVPDRGKDAWGAQLALPTPEQRKQLDELTRARDEAKQRLSEKMKSLEPRRAEWEKQILAFYEAGDLAWRVQRPLTAKAANGGCRRYLCLGGQSHADGTERQDFTSLPVSTGSGTLAGIQPSDH